LKNQQQPADGFFRWKKSLPSVTSKLGVYQKFKSRPGTVIWRMLDRRRFCNAPNSLKELSTLSIGIPIPYYTTKITIKTPLQGNHPTQECMCSYVQHT
jgi:hypothetical protein